MGGRLAYAARANAQDDRDDAIDLARGLLVVLATAPLVALAGRAPAFQAIGALIVAPGLLFLAGLCARPAFARPWRAFAARRIVGPAAFFALAAALAALVGVAAMGGARAGLTAAAPALTLLALPPLYAPAARALLRVGGAKMWCAAGFAHVFGAFAGPSLRPALMLFVFYLAGAMVQPAAPRLRAAARRRPFEAAVAFGILVLTAAALGMRAPGGAFSALTVGPPVLLLLGFGAGLGALAVAGVLEGDVGWLARVGALARPIALFWAPVFFALVACAPARTPLGAPLLALACATLAGVASAADIVAASLTRKARARKDRARKEQAPGGARRGQADDGPARAAQA